MIRRPPRSTQGVSSAASDVYKRQCLESPNHVVHGGRCLLGVQNMVCTVAGVPWVLQMYCLRCFWPLLLGLAAGAGGEARMLCRGAPGSLESPNHVVHGARCVLGVQNTVCSVPGIPWVFQMCCLRCLALSCGCFQKASCSHVGYSGRICCSFCCVYTTPWCYFLTHLLRFAQK